MRNIFLVVGCVLFFILGLGSWFCRDCVCCAHVGGDGGIGGVDDGMCDMVRGGKPIFVWEEHGGAVLTRVLMCMCVKVFHVKCDVK